MPSLATRFGANDGALSRKILSAPSIKRTAVIKRDIFPEGEDNITRRLGALVRLSDAPTTNSQGETIASPLKSIDASVTSLATAIQQAGQTQAVSQQSANAVLTLIRQQMRQQGLTSSAENAAIISAVEKATDAIKQQNPSGDSPAAAADLPASTPISYADALRTPPRPSAAAPSPISAAPFEASDVSILDAKRDFTSLPLMPPVVYDFAYENRPNTRRAVKWQGSVLTPAGEAYLAAYAKKEPASVRFDSKSYEFTVRKLDEATGKKIEEATGEKPQTRQAVLNYVNGNLSLLR